MHTVILQANACTTALRCDASLPPSRKLPERATIHASSKAIAPHFDDPYPNGLLGSLARPNLSDSARLIPLLARGTSTKKVTFGFGGGTGAGEGEREDAREESADESDPVDSRRLADWVP